MERAAWGESSDFSAHRTIGLLTSVVTFFVIGSTSGTNYSQVLDKFRSVGGLSTRNIDAAGGGGDHAGGGGGGGEFDSGADDATSDADEDIPL